jgi:uncharacterized protein (TIGR02145 family)
VVCSLCEPTRTPTQTPTHTPSQTTTNTPTPTQTPSHTPTQTQTPTNTSTPTVTPTHTSTSTPTQTQTQTQTNTNTPSRSNPCANCVEHDVTIGSQIWAGCNLNLATYRDGTIIPQVTGTTEWSGLTTGAWCYSYNNSSNGPIYGKLYNWYAVMGIYDESSLLDPLLRKQLAPSGYHIPSDPEWSTLTTYLGGESVAGGKMKQANNCYWSPPNTNATNSSLFTALPSGYREYNGLFSGLGSNSTFWSSTESSAGNSWIRFLFYINDDAYRGPDEWATGLAVRCIKD